jgi:anthranilate synthase component 1
VKAGQALPAGLIEPIARRLPEAPDPLALYRALSEGGTAPHTFLLESADRATRTGERSLIGAGAALRIVADAERTTVIPLSPNGAAAVAWLAGAADGAGPEQLVVRHPRRAEGTVDERERFRQPSPLDVLRRLAFEPRLAARPNPWCHLVAGVLGYDLLDYFERLPPGRPDPLDQPALEFWLPDRIVVVDHVRRSTTLVATAWGGPGFQRRYHDATRALDRLIRLVSAAPAAAEPIPDVDSDLTAVAVDQDDAEYAAVVSRLKREIEAGEVYQIVPSRSFSHPCADPLAGYGRLRARNPSPYLFYFQGPARTLFGASPETCLRVESDRRRV